MAAVRCLVRESEWNPELSCMALFRHSAPTSPALTRILHPQVTS
jgi:hypothetical protein